jgi:hypothetical protein
MTHLCQRPRTLWLEAKGSDELHAALSSNSNGHASPQRAVPHAGLQRRHLSRISTFHRTGLGRTSWR